MSVDYGIYATKGKRMLLAIRAMVKATSLPFALFIILHTSCSANHSKSSCPY